MPKIHKQPRTSSLGSKLRQRVAKPEALKLTDDITFGKHKGKTVAYVIRNDVDYLERMLRERMIALDTKATESFTDALLDAVEIKAQHNRQFESQVGDLPF